MLFFDQPELFYTINIIPGILYKNISITLALGGTLLFTTFIISVIKNRYKAIKRSFNKIIIIIFILFWLPLYMNHFYNNFYDLIENIRFKDYDINEKRILRLCNIDHRQNSGGVWCKLMSFVLYMKSKLPSGVEVKFITSEPIRPFLNYFFYPDNIFSDNDDYVIFYYPDKYIFQNDILYKTVGSKYLKVGEFSLIGGLDQNRLILKKIEN